MPDQRRTSPRCSCRSLVGGLVAVALGVYGRVHTPTGYAVGPAGFSGALAMKAWLTTGAFVLAVVQILSALVMWGRIKLDVPWIGALHRWSGRVAFLLTLPVAFHCLYALGAQFDVPRVMIHSLLGLLLLRCVHREDAGAAQAGTARLDPSRCSAGWRSPR